MRLRFVPAAVLLLCLASLPAFGQWEWGRPRPPKTGACFYKGPGFRGDYFCLKVGERWPSMPAGFNDKISSIQVFSGARLRLFNNSNFGGINILIDQSVDDLRRIRLENNPSKSWNNRISSLAVFREHDEWEERRR